MQGKMKGFKSLNTSPLDNTFCNGMACRDDTICSHCYSRRALKTYATNGRKPWKRNGYILSKKVLDEEKLPDITDKYFRFHSHGELINENHLINFVNIAKKNPDTNFVLYTKRKDLIKKIGKCGVSNIRYIYSEPLINNPCDVIPEGFDGKFRVFSRDYVQKHNIDINCEGKSCMECLKCYTGGIRIANELIK